MKHELPLNQTEYIRVPGEKNPKAADSSNPEGAAKMPFCDKIAGRAYKAPLNAEGVPILPADWEDGE